MKIDWFSLQFSFYFTLQFYRKTSAEVTRLMKKKKTQKNCWIKLTKVEIFYQMRLTFAFPFSVFRFLTPSLCRNLESHQTLTAYPAKAFSMIRRTKHLRHKNLNRSARSCTTFSTTCSAWHGPPHRKLRWNPHTDYQVTEGQNTILVKLGQHPCKSTIPTAGRNLRQAASKPEDTYACWPWMNIHTPALFFFLERKGATLNRIERERERERERDIYVYTLVYRFTEYFTSLYVVRDGRFVCFANLCLLRCW